MSHGMEIYSSGGHLTYSSSDVTWNQVDFFFVPAFAVVTSTSLYKWPETYCVAFQLRRVEDGSTYINYAFYELNKTIHYGIETSFYLDGYKYERGDWYGEQVDGTRVYYKIKKTRMDLPNVKNYPVIAGKEVLVTQMMINPPPIDRKAIAHTIAVNGTEVTVSGGTEDTYILVLMR